MIYVESVSMREQILRPIDFPHNGFEIPYPLEGPNEEQDDPSYLPPEMLVLLRTKQQGIDAINSSCRHAENFLENLTVSLPNVLEREASAWSKK
ncbi:hypothetical protein KIN20_011039 [Parelaphostrongylus tenuis]|uniref:Uncharacterized protein n=1 Tax=Parelaphostrongylus tenuis TaxID=148309 RepID=A0AAD5QPK7_PARTN|nr:hypothetical protein KIN20_011039 [Parelaphostrongylus tenuis]